VRHGYDPPGAGAEVVAGARRFTREAEPPFDGSPSSCATWALGLRAEASVNTETQRRSALEECEGDATAKCS